MASAYYNSPIGILKIKATNDALTDIHYVREQGESTPNNIIAKAIKQLEEYFAGKRTTFDIPLAPSGTEYREKIWQALTTIPYGKTTSYKDIATLTGNPKASRAVGGANNKNPISIIIPCHRVVGASGRMVGYAGGVDKKEFLLALEHETTA
jgi:methylated-DNA-[protein]-cysteine S-methyltransferase